MKRLVVNFAAAALCVVPVLALASTGAAQAQGSAEVTLVHGIPETPVDVLVDGEVVVSAFAPGTTTSLSAFSGTTLSNVTVLAAGTQSVLIGPIAELPIPASGSHSIVAHLDETGLAVLSSFANNGAAPTSGRTRVTVRHVAEASGIDLLIGTQRPITNLANGGSAEIEVASGTLSNAQIAASGGAALLDVPATPLPAASNVVLFVVGSAGDDTLGVVVQTVGTAASSAQTPTSTTAAPTTTVAAATTTTVAGATTTTVAGATTTTAAVPSAVNTGSPLSSPLNVTLLVVGVVALAVMGGSLAGRRRLLP